MVAINMEMPDSCALCRVRHECKALYVREEFEWYYERFDDCPLVEIVTCKDCKRRSQRYCTYHEHYIENIESGYCSFGERERVNGILDKSTQ